MTIEQEFFEAFGIRKIRRCELDDECFMGFGHSCEECDIYGQAYEVYPPITPEIVLELEEIIIEHTFAYINMEGRKIIENAPFGYIYKYGLYECHCGISSAHKIGKGKTRIESLLNICIQLKDEIQDQVKALFNA